MCNWFHATAAALDVQQHLSAYARRMPMYEYRCRACGHTFDRLRPAAEAGVPAPCDCGSADTTRLMSMIARPATGAELPMAGGGSAPAGGGGCCGGGCCG